jgi:hypothetical protein
MCIPPIALAIYELFANGMQSFVGGFIAVMSGPIVFTVFKRLRKGVPQQDVIAEEDAEISALRALSELAGPAQPSRLEGGLDA